MRTKLLGSTTTKRVSADAPSTICAVVPAHWDSAPSLRSRQRRESLRNAACVRVALTQLESERETPKLLHGPGVDPQKITLFPTKTAAKTETKVRRPTAASVRNLLAEVLRTADSLDAFVLDYFPDVHGEFASGMTRDKRRSLLLEMHQPEVVLERLRRSKPKQVEANESVLEWEG